MALPKGLNPLVCHCGAQASWAGDALSNCRCDGNCVICNEEPAEALYQDQEVCISCGMLAIGRNEMGLEPFAPREPEPLGQPLPPLIRETPDGIRIFDEDAFVVVESGRS